jgi:hypothetical protein
VQFKKPATSLSIVLGVFGVVLVGCSIPMKVSLKQHDRHYSHPSNPNQVWFIFTGKMSGSEV